MLAPYPAHLVLLAISTPDKKDAGRDEGRARPALQKGETLRGCRAKLNLPLNDLAVYISDVLLLTICGQLKITMLAD